MEARALRLVLRTFDRMANSRRLHLVADSPRLSAFPLSRRVGLLLRVADFRVRDLLQRYVNPVGISIFQYAVLALVEASDRQFVTSKSLCALLRIDEDEMLKQTMPLVDRLFLQRKTTAKPPHAASFAVTDFGRSALDLITSRVRDGHDKLREEFTEQEWEDGLRFLMRLSDLEADVAIRMCGSVPLPCPATASD